MQIQVTKLEAARRQLETAINLWVDDGDVVSIHTLAAAAHGIIHDLNCKKKGPPLMFNSPAFTKGEEKKTVAILKSFENFAKHADDRKSKEKELGYDMDIALCFIFTCTAGLGFLKERLTNIEFSFQLWFWVNRPQFLNEQIKEMLSKNFEVRNLDRLRSISKKQFMSHALQIAANTRRN